FRRADDSVNHSVSNQVVLIRGSGANLTRPAYFMTFGSYKDDVAAAERGRLITYLDATFDAAEPRAAATQRHYVPSACEQCHGLGKAKLNYFDTDHWFDRVQNDDFDEVATNQPLLFDAGTNDPTKPQFKRAFNILRTLNSEIRDQNHDADGEIASFQQLA